MHRTKTQAIVKKILGPHFRDELQQEIKDVPFSLLVDESTDIAVNKLFGVSIRDFSASQKRIISTFLSLVEVQECDAIALEREIRYKL